MEAPEADKMQFVSAQNVGNVFLEFKNFLGEQPPPPRPRFAPPLLTDLAQNVLLLVKFPYVRGPVYVNNLSVVKQNVFCISMGECNTILSAYTKYRHLG